MRVVQSGLILGVLLVVLRLVRARGARVQAIRRFTLLVFAAGAVVSIVLPEVWTRFANLVGVGRGTDMVLYTLVVAFLGFTVSTVLKFRDLETRYTRLARRIALDEAPRPPAAATPPAGSSR